MKYISVSSENKLQSLFTGMWLHQRSRRDKNTITKWRMSAQTDKINNEFKQLVSKVRYHLWLVGGTQIYKKGVFSLFWLFSDFGIKSYPLLKFYERLICDTLVSKVLWGVSLLTRIRPLYVSELSKSSIYTNQCKFTEWTQAT